jgi:protein involved in polysaccharide export with SLBB domain
MITQFGRVKSHFILFAVIILLLLPAVSLVTDLFAEDNPMEKPQSEQSNQRRSPTFRPGDAVEISVFPDTTSFLNDIFSIDGEGFISLPIKGRVQISEMNEAEFFSYLTENFRQYIKTTDIQVKPLIRTSLLGGFITPGLYYVDENLTLWQLIQMGGGTELEDGLKKMKWERNRKTVQKNLIPYFESGKSLNQLGFQSGDQIWAPRPERTNWLDRLNQFLPLVSVAVTSYTLYLTYTLAAR